MTVVPKQAMTVDEFLVWGEAQAQRHELIHGVPVAQAPQTVGHAKFKAAVFLALRDGIQRAGVSCRAFPDGVTIRVSDT